jgi:hypothetical protein
LAAEGKVKNDESEAVILSVTVLDGIPGHIKAATPPLCDMLIVEMDAGSAVFSGLIAAQLVVVLNDQSRRLKGV